MIDIVLGGKKKILNIAETPQSEARAAQASIAQRLGKIEDIVPIIGFLASADAQWITAQTIFVNGGYLAR